MTFPNTRYYFLIIADNEIYNIGILDIQKKLIKLLKYNIKNIQLNFLKVINKFVYFKNYFSYT